MFAKPKLYMESGQSNIGVVGTLILIIRRKEWWYTFYHLIGIPLVQDKPGNTL